VFLKLGRQNASAPLRIVAWPAHANQQSNPYTSRLYSEIAKEHSVKDIEMSKSGLKLSLAEQQDIFHIHWIDKAFWDVSPLKTITRVLFTVCIIAILKMRGTRVVWTVHDPAPHEMAVTAKLERGVFKLPWLLYQQVIKFAVDGLIFLSAAHVSILTERFPRFSRLPFAVIAHPHYRGIYPNEIKFQEARDKLDIKQNSFQFLFIGKARPYKNVEGLILAFREYDAPESRLIVAGEADSPVYEKLLVRTAVDDARITLKFQFIADDELQNYLNAADVVIFPFKEVTNSGSVLLALSFARPVAAIDSPNFRELQKLVGARVAMSVRSPAFSVAIITHR
jgi:beta-1,4-mannosyltransferase